jgi:hypothetical protein
MTMTQKRLVVLAPLSIGCSSIQHRLQQSHGSVCRKEIQEGGFGVSSFIVAEGLYFKAYWDLLISLYLQKKDKNAVRNKRAA